MSVPNLTTTSISSDFYSKSIGEFYRTGLFSDLLLVPGRGGDGTRCHALVMASICPIIRESLRGKENEETETQVVILPEFTKEEIREFVDGLYKKAQGRDNSSRRSRGCLEALLSQPTKQADPIQPTSSSSNPPVKRKRGRPRKVRPPENGLPESEPLPKSRVRRKRIPRVLDEDEPKEGDEEDDGDADYDKVPSERKKKKAKKAKKALGSVAKPVPNKSDQDTIAQMRRVCRGCFEKTTLDPSSSDLCKSASCSGCEMEFKGHQWLLKHFKSKHEGAWVVVTSESKKEKKSRQQQQHQEEPAIIKRYLCNDCGKTFASTGSLKTHVDMVHKKLKPYQCKLCDSAFYASYHLQKHVNSIHKKLKQFVCSECGRGFVLMQHLTRHIKIVHQKVRYECHICHKGLATVTGLKTHLESVHSSSGTVKCEVCGQTLAHLVALRSHLKRRHPEAGAFRCLHCNRGFLTEVMLKIHTTKHHKVRIGGDALAVATAEIVMQTI